MYIIIYFMNSTVNFTVQNFSSNFAFIRIDFVGGYKFASSAVILRKNNALLYYMYIAMLVLDLTLLLK